MEQNTQVSPAGFPGYINGSSDDFVGRDWVFKVINNWLADPDETRVILLVGEPGSGKTAISSRLLQFSQGIVSSPDNLSYLAHDFLSAYFYCSARDSLSLEPYKFAELISLQLAQRYPAFANALLEKSEDKHIHIEVQQRGGQGQRIGVFINRLEVSGVTPEYAFNRLVREPLDALFMKPFNQQIVILVDALDEALSYSGGVNIVSLLAHINMLHKQVRFILTSRKDERIENTFQGTKIFEISSDQFGENNRDDIHQYVSLRLHSNEVLIDKIAQIEPTQKDDLVETIISKADGNFLYVRFLLDAIVKGMRSINELEGLPEGLDELYFDSLGRAVTVGKRDWLNEYAPLMGVLSVAQEGLTPTQLQNFTKQSYSSTWQYLSDLQQFLEQVKSQDEREDQETKYRLYHQSIVDFLCKMWLDDPINRSRKRNLFYLHGDEWHKQIADYLRKQFTTHREKYDDIYGLRYLSVHMMRAKLQSQLYEIINKGEVCNEWAEAKVKIFGSYASYLSDLELVRNWVESKEGWNIGHQIRCTLIESSIRSLATIPPELLIQQVKSGAWRQEGALEYISYMLNEKMRTEAIVKIVSLIKSNIVKTNLLKIARTITNEEYRSEALSQIVAYLPEQLQQESVLEAINAIEIIKTEEKKSEALNCLMAHLPSHLKDTMASTMLEIARKMQSGGVKVLSRLVIYLPGQLQVDIVHEIIDLIGQLEAEEKSLALGMLANSLPPDLKTSVIYEMLGIALEIEEERIRLEALSQLMYHIPERLQVEVVREALALLPQASRIFIAGLTSFEIGFDIIGGIIGPISDELKAQVMEEVVDAIEKIQSEAIRAEALGQLVSHLPEKLRIKIVDNVLDVIQKIKDKVAYAKALGTLEAYMPEDVRSLMAHQALKIVEGSVTDEKWEGIKHRAVILSWLMPYLPLPLKAEALELVPRVDNRWGSVEVLGRLAKYVPEELIGDALRAVQKISWRGGPRDAAFKVLLDGLPEHLKLHAAQEVLAIVDVQDIDVEIWSYLLKYLPQGSKIEAARVALKQLRELDDQDWRVRGLSQLMAYLPGELNADVMEVAQEIGDESERVVAIIGIIEFLEGGLQSEAIAKAMKDVKKIKDLRRRISLIAELIKYIPEKLKTEITLDALWFFPQALKYSGGAGDERAGLDEMSKLIGALPNSLKSKIAYEALDMIPKIQIFVLRENVLNGLLNQLSEEVKAEIAHKALDIVSRIAPETIRADALGALLARLPEKSKKEIAQKAVDMVRGMQEEDARIRAWRWAIQYLPDELQVEIAYECFTVARKMQNEWNSIEIFTWLIAYLPNELKNEVIQLIYKEENEIRRAEVLTKMVEYLPVHLQVEVVRNVLTIIYEMDEEEVRIEALSTLVKYVPASLYGELLNWIQEEWIQIDSWVAIPTLLLAYTEPTAFQELIFSLRQSVDETILFMQLLNVVEHLPAELQKEVIQKNITYISSLSDEETRTAELLKLINYLPEVLQTEVVEKHMEFALRIADEREHIFALLQVVEYLSEELQTEVMEKSITFISQITNKHLQIATLLEVIEYLPAQLQPEAASKGEWIVRGIANVEIRISALTRLSAYMSEMERYFTHRKVLNLTKKITNLEMRVEVLLEVGKYLSVKAQKKALREVLVLIHQEVNTQMRIRLLIKVAACIVGDLRKDILNEVLALVEEIGDSLIRCEMMIQILIYVSGTIQSQVLYKIMFLIRGIEDEEKRAFLLVSAIPYLPDDIKTEVVRMAMEIVNTKVRFDMLINLVKYLSEPLKTQVMQQILLLIAAQDVEAVKIITLSGLLAYLKDEEKAASLSGVLQVARQTEDTETKAYLLGKIASHLPKETQFQVTNEAVQAAKDYIVKGVSSEIQENDAYIVRTGLRRLAKYFPSELLYQVGKEVGRFICKLSDEDEKVQMMVRLLENHDRLHGYYDEELMPFTEAMISYVAHEGGTVMDKVTLAITRTTPYYMHREELATSFTSQLPTDQVLDVLFDLLKSNESYMIGRLVSSWKEKDFLGFEEDWRDHPELLRFLAHNHRAVAVHYLSILIPLLIHIGHASVANEMFFSIRDVSHWWP